MNNPEIYIFVALGFSFALSWAVSKFSGLSIDLFNTSIGLLFGASANLALMTNLPGQNAGPEFTQPALTDYAILLVFLQFAFGILIISAHFAHRNLVKAKVEKLPSRLKEAVFYSWSSTVSLFSCYVMAIFFLHSRAVFAPIEASHGELQIVIDRWLQASYVPIGFWIALFVFTTSIRFWREPITAFARP